MTDITCDKCDETFRADGGPAVRKATCPHCGNVKAVPDPAGTRSALKVRQMEWVVLAIGIVAMAIGLVAYWRGASLLWRAMEAMPK